MKVLITGCCGFIGSALSRLLLKAGFFVRGLDNLSRNDGNSLIELTNNPNFEFIKGDVTKPDDCEKAVQDADFIVHAAALVGEPLCKMNPTIAWAVNYRGTENLLKVNVENKPFLLCSTGSVYGAVLNGLCTETSSCNTRTEYGLSKLAAEKLTLAFNNTMVYRFATACGVSPNLRLDLLVNDLVYQAVKNKSIVMYQSDFKRTFISVTDFTISILHAIENWDNMIKVGRIFNVGDEGLNYSKREIGEIIKKHTGCSVFHGDNGYKDPDVRDYEVSYKLINSTGFYCTESMDGIIQSLLKAIPLITGDRRFYQV